MKDPKSPGKEKVGPSVDESVDLYQQRRPLYATFTGKLKSLLEDLLSGEAISFHVIESRTKEIPSFREKITRANKGYQDPLTEITDFSGLRVIVYYLEDVTKVCNLLEREFSIDKDSSVDKGALLKTNEFGYRSVHYIVRLPARRTDLLEWRSFGALVAEVQVRTVLQHAWASISHTLEYKNEAEVPSPLRRKLSRLAGLLELSDEEFADLRHEERKFSGKVTKKLDKGDFDLELNSVSLTTYIKESKALGFVSRAGEAAGFDVKDYSEGGSSELIRVCSYLGIETIRQLDDQLKANQLWIEDYFRDQFGAGYGAWEASTYFLVVLILLRLHRDQVNVEFLTDGGWDSNIATRVIGVAKASQR